MCQGNKDMLHLVKTLHATSMTGRKIWKWRVEIDGEFRAEIRNVSFGHPDYRLFDPLGTEISKVGTRADIAAFESHIANAERHGLIPTLLIIERARELAEAKREAAIAAERNRLREAIDNAMSVIDRDPIEARQYLLSALTVAAMFGY